MTPQGEAASQSARKLPRDLDQPSRSVGHSLSTIRSAHLRPRKWQAQGHHLSGLADCTFHPKGTQMEGYSIVQRHMQSQAPSDLNHTHLLTQNAHLAGKAMQVGCEDIMMFMLVWFTGCQPEGTALLQHPYV